VRNDSLQSLWAQVALIFRTLQSGDLIKLADMVYVSHSLLD
jgi:hypothetical protein